MRNAILPAILLTCLLACNNNKTSKNPGNADSVGSNVIVEKPVSDRSLVGKWKFIDAKMEKMNETDRQEMLNNAVIEFTHNGKFFSQMKDDASEGTYFVDEKAGTLTTREGSKEEEFALEWNGDEVTIVNEDGRVTMKRISSSNSDTRATILGKWRVDDFDVRDNQELRSMLNEMVFEYLRNGRYHCDSHGEETEHGTFTYDERTKVLIQSPENDHEKTSFDVEFPGNNKMRLKFRNGTITLKRE